MVYAANLMKHIGIVGVSAEGASLCYKTICSEATKQLGGLRHPEISLHEQSSHLYFETQPDWKAVADLLLISLKKLASIGADFAIIPSNTIHYALPFLESISPTPILSIVEATANECALLQKKNVAVLGTRLTMQGGLYTSALRQRGIDIILPVEEDQERIDRIIFQEIVPGKATKETTETVCAMIDDLRTRGAEVVILGCTELPIIIGDHNASLPTIDTTRLLAKTALDFSLRE